MTTITYRASTDTMGDTSPVHAEKFREWAFAQLEARFPDEDIEVLDDAGNQCSTAYSYDPETADLHDEIVDFCANLWDRCPWDWIGDDNV